MTTLNTTAVNRPATTRQRVLAHIEDALLSAVDVGNFLQPEARAAELLETIEKEAGLTAIEDAVDGVRFIGAA